MIFIETKIKDVFIIETELMKDKRGFFARAWCKKEFEAHGLSSRLVQCNISFNKKKGTLRGLHFQDPPYQETKLVRCTMGAIYDVIVDLRPESATFKQWFAKKLNAENHQMIYVPEGLAHGYQTLVKDTEVFYQVSEFYHPESERGIRWDDPMFNIPWPIPNPILSKKDASYPYVKFEKVETEEL